MKRVVAAMLVFAMCAPLFAQTAGNGQSKPADRRGPAKSSSKEADISSTKASPVQPMNVEYTESIIKNTTDKMFLTEIVDHLPASATVPSPEKVLGYPIGTPNKLT